MNTYLTRVLLVCFVCLSSFGFSLEYSMKDLRDSNWQPYEDRHITVEERMALMEVLLEEQGIANEAEAASVKALLTEEKARLEAEEAERVADKIREIEEFNNRMNTPLGDPPAIESVSTEVESVVIEEVPTLDTEGPCSEEWGCGYEAKALWEAKIAAYANSNPINNTDNNLEEELRMKAEHEAILKAASPTLDESNEGYYSSDEYIQSKLDERNGSSISDWTDEDFIATLSGAQAEAWGRPYSGSSSTRDSYTLTLDGDSYATSESSWNIWDVTNQSWYYTDNQAFLSTAAFDTVVELATGTYELTFWDSWGDSSYTTAYLDGAYLGYVYIYDGPTTLTFSVADAIACDDADACNTGVVADCVYPENGFDCDGGCAEDVMSLVVGGGSFASEVSWSLSGINASGGVGTFSLCLADGDYTFSGCDSYGDGWNGNTAVLTSSAGVVFLNNAGPGAELAGGECADELFNINTSGTPGCTDSTACNYDSAATIDDSSCTYANACGSCDGDESCLGCTDSAATNYDADATVDDGSCTYPGGTCADAVALTLPVVDGAGTTAGYGDDYSSSPCSSSYMGGDDYVATFTLAADSFVSGSISDCSWCALHITSDCVDSAADCSAVASGSSGGSFSDALLSAGTYFATVSTWPSPQSTAFTLNLSAEEAITGCMDTNAENFNPLAQMSCADDDLDGIGDCCEFLAVQGCTDANACNYDPQAEEDNGSCTLPGDAIDCALALGDGASGTSDDFGKYYSFSIDDGAYLSHILSACGTAFDTKLYVYDSNGDQAFYNDDGCSGFGSGSSYASQLSWDGSLAAGNYVANLTPYSSFTTVSDWTLSLTSVSVVEGCMDVNADNYDANANVACADCCIFSEVYGCMDSTACNYNADATASDDSCYYEGGAWDCATTDGVSSVDAGYPYGNWTSVCSNADGWGATLSFSSGADNDIPDYYIVAQTTLDGVNNATYDFVSNGPSTTLYAGECASFRVVDYYGYLGVYYDGPATLSAVVSETPDPSLVGGCTDSTATNYDADADYDDGSCTYPGATCADAATLTLPVVDGAGTTAGYGDDYSSSPCSSSYMGGDDYVATFTLDADAFVSGSISDCSWCALHITSDCVDSAADCSAVASGSSGGSFSDVLLSAGTYFATVSTWPSPQSTDFTLNLSADALVEGCTDGTALNYNADANVACADADADGLQDCCEYPASCDTFTVTMGDSFGDSWNGNTITIGAWSSDGPDAGCEATCTYVGDCPDVGDDGDYTNDACYAVEEVCLVDGLYDIVVGGGSYMSEVSWSISDSDGNVLLSGGAPVTSCLDNSEDLDCPVGGCLDLADAPNYNADADYDDGTCDQYPGAPYWYWNSSYVDYYLGCNMYYLYQDSDGDGVVDQQGDGTCDQSGSYGLNCQEFGYDGCDCGNQYVDSDDFCYETPVYGCTDSLANNPNDLANVDCTDPPNQDDCEPCDYSCTDNTISVTMGDSYGDGWNGASLTIDGNVLTGPDSGCESVPETGETECWATADLCLVDGTYDVVMVGGSYPSEIAWNIVDNNENSFNYGNVVLEGDGYSGTLSLTLPVPEYVCGDGTCNDSSYTDVDGNEGTETCGTADDADACAADCGACAWVDQDAPELTSYGTYYINDVTNETSAAIQWEWNALTEGNTCADIIADPSLDQCYVYSSGSGQYTCEYIETFGYDCSLVVECGLCWEPNDCSNAGGNQFWIGDGYCDSANNTSECGFDGGDCCCDSCDTTDFSNYEAWDCGIAGYDCQDPDVTVDDCDCLAADDDASNDCFDPVAACAEAGGFYCPNGSASWVQDDCITNAGWLCDGYGDCSDGADEATVADGGSCTEGCIDSSACNAGDYDFNDASACTYPDDGFDCDGNVVEPPAAGCDEDCDSTVECCTHADCGEGEYCYDGWSGGTCYDNSGYYNCCYFNDSIDTDCDGDADLDDCPQDCGGTFAGSGSDDELPVPYKYNPGDEDMMLISGVFGFREVPRHGPSGGGTWTDLAMKRITIAGAKYMPTPTVINLETGEVTPGTNDNRAVTYTFSYSVGTSSSAGYEVLGTSFLIYGFSDLTEACGVVFATNSAGEVTADSNESCSQAGFSDYVDCDGDQIPESYLDWLGDGYCDITLFACDDWDCDNGDCLDVCGVCDGPGATYECWDLSYACDAESCPDEPVACIAGDLNDDDSVDVLDVVALVAVVLSSGYEECGDMNSDGSIDVLDVVAQVAVVLGGNARGEDATSAVMSIDGSTLNISGNGFIGAVQITLSHGSDFSISLTDDAMVADYATSDNMTTLIVVAPGSEEIFTATGDYDVAEVIVANSSTYVDVIEPGSFTLDAAYPNPFNPSTSLSLNMPVEGYVSVKAYNLVGQVVGVIAEGSMDAGIHTMTWNASSLSSGVYLITAEYAGSISTQKVMLMK